MNNIPQDNEPRKQCAGPCQQFFPATPDYFSRNKNRKDGLQTLCKVCMSEYKKQHYQANIEEIRKKHRDYRESHLEQERERLKRYVESHKDHLRDYHAKYYEENKEQMLEEMKQYYADNRDHKTAYQRQYREENLERVTEHKRAYYQTEQGKAVARAHGHKRRAQKRASGGTHNHTQLQEQLKRQKHKCYYCKASLRGISWHADHIIPLSRGGSNDISNIVCSCPDCNMKKHDKLPHEWVDGGRLL